MRAWALFGVGAAAAIAVLIVSHAAFGKFGIMDAGFITVGLLALATDVAAVVLLLTRQRTRARRLLAAPVGALAAAVAFTIVVLRPGDPAAAPYELSVAFLAFVSPALAAILVGVERPTPVHRAAAIVLCVVGIVVGLAAVGYAWRDDSGLPFSLAIRAIMIGFVAMFALAAAGAWSARPTRPSP